MLEQLETSNPESIITLYDISWEKFEAIASLLEDTKVRLTYLDGTLDLTLSALKPRKFLDLPVHLPQKSCPFYAVR